MLKAYKFLQIFKLLKIHEKGVYKNVVYKFVYYSNLILRGVFREDSRTLPPSPKKRSDNHESKPKTRNPSKMKTPEQTWRTPPRMQG